MELKKEWAFVAVYNGKKVKKYITTCEELKKYEWISESKFRFPDMNNIYHEGIILAKKDDEQTLQTVISTKNLRCPHNAFSPFPDPAVSRPIQNIKPIETVGKWKIKVAANAINNFSTPIKRYKMLSNEEIPNNHAVEKTPVAITNPKEGNESALSSIYETPKINHQVRFEETPLLQERERSEPTSTHRRKDTKEIIKQIDEAVISSETSSDEDESNSNSENVTKYSRNGKKTKKLETDEEDVSNYCIISKEEYNRLLDENKSLKAKLSGQENRRAKDLKILKLAQRLIKAIDNCYDKKERAKK